ASPPTTAPSAGYSSREGSQSAPISACCEHFATPHPVSHNCQTIWYCLTIMTSDAAPVRPDAVVASLRSAILTGVLAPGDAVTEALVADSFHVARPTARIAIDKLVAAGILAPEPAH